MGKSFDLSLTVQKAWNKGGPNGGYQVKAGEVDIDLRGAPSLQFDPNVEDYRADATGSITLNPAAPTTPQGNVTPILIPAGVSSITFRVTPSNQGPDGPDLTLIVGPAGQGVSIRQPSGGRGQGIELVLVSENATPYIGTLVDVGAETQMVDNSVVPPVILTATSVAFSIEVVASFDLQNVRTFQGTFPKVLSGPGASFLLPVPLIATAEPQAGEQVRITVNTTGYGDHPGVPGTGGTIDWGNFTDPAKDGAVTPLVIDVTMKDGKVMLTPQETVIVRPSVQNGATMVTISEVIGYAAAFLLISSIASGGMLGKASRRSLNTLFGSAKRRVAFHNFLSYGIILASLVHMVLFLIEAFYEWTLGLIWGGLATLAMLGLGVTGALQVPMIRRWSYGVWRWNHYGMTVAVIVFTLVHMLLDGVHFGDVQGFLGWKDPLRDLVT